MQKGFGLIGILLIVVISAAAGAGIFYLGTRFNTTSQESKDKTAQIVDNTKPSPTSTPIVEKKDSNLKEYSNRDYNFSFKYPLTWNVNEDTDYNNQKMIQVQNEQQQIMITFAGSAPAIGCGPVDESMNKQSTFDFGSQNLVLKNFCGDEHMYITTATNKEGVTLWLIMKFINTDSEKDARILLKNLSGLNVPNMLK